MWFFLIMKVICALGLLAMGFIGCLSAEVGFDSVDGPNVRGSKTIFTRSPDHRTLTKRTFTEAGALFLLTIYRMDEHGNPTGCKIYDGKNTEMFKTSYGYRKSDGQLVEERMFDSRVKRIDPEGNEMPVRRFLYTYDALGKRSAPIAFTLIPGQTADDVFGKASALEVNPFLDKR